MIIFQLQAEYHSHFLRLLYERYELYECSVKVHNKE